MALTPADVHNVVFNHPPIGKRGYDENEVDQFLDLIEDTLAEMQDENADLQAQLAKGNTGNPSSDSSVSDDTIQKYEDQIADLEAKLEASQETADTKIKQLQSDLKSAQSSGAKGGSSSTEASAQSTRVLALAQETADRLAAEAQHDADETRSGAQQEKAAVIADAKSQAEATLKAAQDNAQALQQDAARKHDEIMTSVHNQQSVLEARIAKLQTYEREYRTRMKTFLESQLEELESRDDEPSQDS